MSEEKQERRRGWVRFKWGDKEVEAQGLVLILLVIVVALQGVTAWAFNQHMLHGQANTVALREMVCLLRIGPTANRDEKDWCAQQARFSVAEFQGAMAQVFRPVFAQPRDSAEVQKSQ